MLVLESLEKAEAEVADERLGEAARAPPRTHTRTRVLTSARTRSRAHTLRPARTLGVAVDTRSPGFPPCPRSSRAPLGRRLVKAGGEWSVAPGPHHGAQPPGVVVSAFRMPGSGAGAAARASGSGLCAVALQKVWPS